MKQDMQDKSLIMLRVLANRFHEGSADTVLEGLRQEDQQHVFDQHVRSTKTAPALNPPAAILSNIHYSWLIPKIESLPKEIIPLILSSLPPPLGSQLRTHLKDTSPEVPLAQPMKTFLINSFYKRLNPDEVLPIEYLPPSFLTPVSLLKKQELVRLIDFLGLFDLSEEIRKIVDKKALQLIYDTLSNPKHEFLRKCMQQKEKLATSALNLETWKGDPAVLNKLLHHRGLVRLGYALSGQHPDLMWHITHTLDVGRAEKMLEYWKKDSIPGVTPVIGAQVLQVIQFFNEYKGKEL